jgi:uncharacterized repeat protein (TIGR03803 family)
VRETVLYSFGRGQFPNFVTYVNGALYGTTSYGGPDGVGTIFRITASGVESVLHVFHGRDGIYPTSLTDVNGVFYGTTISGGTNGGGTIFRIDPSGAFRVLYNFAGGSDGLAPNSALINVDGVLYGTTDQGGIVGAGQEFGNGTVFKITTSGVESVLYRFAGGSDGSLPLAGLTNVNGVLYGTTSFGGGRGCSSAGEGCGTVFKVTTSGTESVIYRFAGGSDGEEPQASLTNVDGVLYGTTVYGGKDDGKRCVLGCGTVFKMTPSGTESVLHRFGGRGDGMIPAANLIDVNGVLYGTTDYGGGAKSDGTVFSITTSGVESVLYSFAGGSDGAYADASLINVNGVFYGMTDSGGTNDGGTLFSLSL